MAKETGLLLRDRVKTRRANYLASVKKKVERNLTENLVPTNHHADPRIACTIVEEASWIEDSLVQDMWAGLLSSSCTEGGDDDSNLLFVNLLRDLTKLQARVLKFACEQCQKQIMRPGGLFHARTLIVSFDKLCEIAEEKDLYRLDRELDFLRSKELLDPHEGGIYAPDPSHARLTPTPLALYMYVRCCGSRASPVEFFGLAQPPEGGQTSGDPAQKPAPLPKN